MNRDNNELLLFVLKQLVKEQIHYEHGRHKKVDLSTVAVPEADFIDRVCVAVWLMEVFYEF